MKTKENLFDIIYKILYSGRGIQDIEQDPKVKEVIYRLYEISDKEEPDYNSLWENIRLRTAKIDRRRLFRRWLAAAAVVVVLISVPSILYYTTGIFRPNPLNGLSVSSPAVKLTLADGSVVALDGQSRGRFIDNGVLLTTPDSINTQLVYLPGDPINSVLNFNAIDVPVAADYRLILADGTKVFLNSASRLKYPVAFTGSERRVFLEGEGYFEVAKDAERPFRVVVRNLEIEALGTAFNINAYEDNGQIQTTLVSGKVVVSANEDHVVLTPGMQAIYDRKQIKVVEVDCREFVAWKDGLFVFNRMSLEDIMQQMKRWYGVDVFFSRENLKQYTFTGMIDRSLPPTETFRVIEKTVDIRFTLRDNTVIIN